MNNPVISVILPVYNGATFLKAAIQSILDQTFGDFELLIINDGSTDDSEKIIRSFHDDRIVYLSNTINRGLVYSLNLGIEKASGRYIARMDADDVSMPERFQQQKDYLQSHQDVSIVASTIRMIDEEGKEAGSWPLDRRTITARQIRKTMPFENCIAHPTVMGNAQLFIKHKYDPAQVNIEDYDLWLRLLASGEKIEKLETPLLDYRIHTGSITKHHLKKHNFFFKHIRTKRVFAFKQLKKGRFNGFVIKTLLSTGLDLLKGIVKTIKGNV